MFVILEHPTSADCLSSGRPPEPLPGHHTGDTGSSLEHSPRAWREQEEPTWHLGDGQCLKAITCCCSLGEGRRGCGCVTAVAPIPAPSMGCLSRALALCRCWHALIASPIAAVNLPRLGIQTSPSLVMASHHSYLLLQKMKGLRNAFIHVTVCIILLCALNFQSGTRRCLNHSNAAQSAPAGRCPFHRAHLLRAALRGHPLHSKHTNAAGPTAVSTFTPHCRHLAAMLRVLQQPCVVSNSEPLQNTPSPSISFLLLLQRPLSPGTCQFLALTHRNHPWQHSLHSQGSQQQVAKKTIE